MAKYFEQGQYNKSIVKLNKESHNMDYLLVLKKIWSEVLKTNLIHIEDNFFSLGGDSIRSMMAVSKLEGKHSANPVFPPLKVLPSFA